MNYLYPTFLYTKVKYCLLLLAVFLISFGASSQSTYSISRFDYEWCQSSYPSAYETADFSILELSTFNSGQDGFTKNQTSRTIQIDLPAGFEFNTSVGSVSATQSGGGPNELTGISFVYNSVTRITVTLTSASTNTKLNTLDFKNFQIRAMYTGAAGNILRTGGTFEIEANTGYPTAAQPLGILRAGTPFNYTGSSVTQASTATVTQFSINREILRIKISGTGDCGGTVTKFNFNTDGGNGNGSDLPASNISNAKVYYTGSSTTFATTNFFGSVTAPNGTFSITGTQTVTAGDNYFWLTYDVPGNANTAAGSNRLDAQLVSFILSGVTRTDATTPTPAGKRDIVGASFYYSRFSGNWDAANIWATTDNGPSCSCEPNGSGVVIIDTGHTVAVNVTRTVDVVQIFNTSTLNGGGSPLTVNSSLFTFGSGRFTLNAKLTVLGNVTLSGSGASNNSRIIDIDGDLTVGAGTSMTGTGGVSGGVDQNIFVGGNLYVDGTLTQSNGKDIVLDVGALYIIAGTGTITTTRQLIMNAGSKTVVSGTNLTINSNFQINGPYTLTNKGTITLNGNLDASSALSQWTNDTSATFNYAGATKMFLTNGTLLCSAPSNTINYSGSVAQTMIFPMVDGKYCNLTLSGSNTKTLSTSCAVIGNWTNNTTFANNSMDVTFSGTGAQSISGTSAPTFYNLKVEKASGTLSLGCGVTVSNQLTLTSGPVDLNSNTLVVSNGVTTGITRTSGYIISELSTNASKLQWNIGVNLGSHVYPFGTSAGTYIPVTIELPSGGGDVGNVTISTYPTTAANTPLPSTVTHINNTSGMNNSANTVDRFWQIDKSVGTGTVNVTFSATAAEVGTITTLRAQRWNATNNGWEAPIVGQSNTATTATVSGVSAFSPWALSGNNTPLPVELVLFEGEAIGHKVKLSWKTQSELNNNHFVVQRSKDGVDFTDLAQVMSLAPNGTSMSPLSYEFHDVEPFDGVTYYRLKQVDHDGTSEYSQIVAVNFSSKKDMTFTLYPNPNKGEFIVDFEGLENNHNVTILVFDQQGRKVYESNFSLHEGTNKIEVIPTEKIASGVYICKLLLEGVMKEIKVIVQ